MSNYYFVVDQGGTKTYCLIMDEQGQIIETIVGEGKVHSIDGLDEAIEVIYSCYSALCQKCNIQKETVKCCVAALSGMDWPFEMDLLQKALILKLQITDVTVVNDSIGAMRSGCDKQSAGVICLGTGANVAICKDRNTQIVFGYYLTDDVQGATAIGLKAWEYALKSNAGVMPITTLTEVFRLNEDFNTFEELVISVTTGQRQLIWKQLSPMVLHEAQLGDVVAQNIIQQFANEIFSYVEAGIKRLDIPANQFPVVLAGGVFKGPGKYIKQQFEILAHKKGYLLQFPVYEPVGGAALLALDIIYDNNIPETVYENFYESGKRCNILLK